MRDPDLPNDIRQRRGRFSVPFPRGQFDFVSTAAIFGEVAFVWEARVRLDLGRTDFVVSSELFDVLKDAEEAPEYSWILTKCACGCMSVKVQREAGFSQ